MRLIFGGRKKKEEKYLCRDDSMEFHMLNNKNFMVNLMINLEVNNLFIVGLNNTPYSFVLAFNGVILSLVFKLI